MRIHDEHVVSRHKAREHSRSIVISVPFICQDLVKDNRLTSSKSQFLSSHIYRETNRFRLLSYLKKDSLIIILTNIQKSELCLH